MAQKSTAVATQDGWSAPANSQPKGWLAEAGTEDGWGSPLSSKSNAPQNRGWLADGPQDAPTENRGWLADGPQDTPPENRGWLADGPQDTPPENRGWLADGPQDDPPEESHGWLTDAPKEEVVSFAGDSSDDVDEEWLDQENWDREEMDEYSPEALPASQADPTAGLFKLLALVAICLVVVAAVIFGNRPKEKPRGPTAAEIAAEALETGRLFVAGASVSIEAKDFQNASLQLKAALPHLDEGLCPQDELDQAYLLLARATFYNKELLVSRDLWAQLGENIPAAREEARVMVTRADQGLRSRAEDLLTKSERELKNGRGKAALSAAQEALDLFEDFKGTDQQRGRAHGALGEAYLAKRVKASARYHLIRAELLIPNGKYTKILNRIGRGKPGQVKEPERAPIQTSYRPSSVPTQNNGVPTMDPNRVRVIPNRVQQPGRPVTTSQAQPQQQRMKEIPAYQRKTNARRGKQKSGTLAPFVNYSDRSKR